MKTRELQAIWWDWLGTSERLLRSLHEQTAALTLRDVERVERIQPELDSMVSRMQEIDESAATCAKELAEEMGTEAHVRGLVRVLEKTEAQQVQSIANRVMVAARHVEQVMAKNRRLIENEMNYINGTVTLLAKSSQSKQGKFSQRPDRAAVLIDHAA